MKKVRSGFFLSALVLALICIESSYAQNKGSSITRSSSSAGMNERFKPIFVGGVVGMALGVSSLSFYGRPQRHLAHVTYGTAFGIIIGAAYSIIHSAAKTFDHLDHRGEMPSNEGWQNLSITKDLEPRDRPWFNFELAAF